MSYHSSSSSPHRNDLDQSLQAKLAPSKIVLVDDDTSLRKCLGKLETILPSDNFIISCDFEGFKLGRPESKLSVGQFSVSGYTFVLDILALRRRAFTYKATGGISFKHILESERYIKLFCDPRNDGVALYREYGIQLTGTVCVQLMNVARRTTAGRKINFVSGLASIIEKSNIPHHKKTALLQKKRDGYASFAGRSEVWLDRPLSKTLIEYAACDVHILAYLYEWDKKFLGLSMMKKVWEYSSLREASYADPYYDPDGRNNTSAPNF